jgi:hypothetical protein
MKSNTSSIIVLAAILNTVTAVEPSSDPIEICTAEYRPVDCGQLIPFLFDNICIAEKAGFDPERCHEISTEPRMCSMIHEPVFCTSPPESEYRNEYSNLCLALEAGFDRENCGPDFSTDPVEPSMCITLQEPVFCSSTSETKDRHEFSNLCFALEAGFNSDNCGPDFSTDPVERDLSVDPIDPDEECTLEYAPVVCDGFHESTTFPNLCAAEKAGFDSNKCTLKTGGLRGQKPTM